MPSRRIAVLTAAAAILVVAACSSRTPECTVGADCASGACDSSGQCAPASSTGHDAGSIETADASPEAEADAPTADDPPAPDAGGCVANGDGTITRAEVPMMAGLHASFLVAENVTVDTAGTMNPDGTRSWDFTGPLSGDHTIVVTTDAPTGQWFSPQFTTASYTSKLSDTSTLLGVFQATGESLLLQGVVSPTSGPQQTQVTYMPAAEVLGLPMKVGTSWGTTSTVSGTAQGIAAYYTEQYASKVDASGTLKVPYGTFEVLRVQTTLTRTVGGVPSQTQSFAFLAECFGPVATVTSQTPETNPSFTNAAEIQRLTP